jgi:hypothetical protein
VVEDSQQWLLRLWFDAVLGQIDRPDTIDCAGATDRMRMSPWRCSPLFELAQEFRNAGLADRQSLLEMIALESIRDHAATASGASIAVRNSPSRTSMGLAR